MKKTYTCLRGQRHFSIFIIFIAIVLAVSGCGRKNTPVVENNLTPALSSEEREKTSPLLTSEGERATSSSETVKTATSTGEIATSTDVIDTSDWKVYRNEEYGFEISYPASYEKNKIYGIWDIGPSGVRYEGKSWGINKYQETLIGVDVYPKNIKDEVLKDYSDECKVTNEQILINKDILANKLKCSVAEGIFIENNKYIYIIRTGYYSTTEDTEWEETYKKYNEILKTLKIY